MYIKLILCAVITEVSIQTHGSPWGICGQQNGSWAGFFYKYFDVPSSLNSINVLYLYFISQTQMLYNHSKWKHYKYRKSKHYKILPTRQVLQGIYCWLFYEVWLKEHHGCSLYPKAISRSNTSRLSILSRILAMHCSEGIGNFYPWMWI